MTDSQLATILTSIVDILTVMNTSYSDDHGQMPAILKTRELIAAASTAKPLTFGSETDELCINVAQFGIKMLPLKDIKRS